MNKYIQNENKKTRSGKKRKKDIWKREAWIKYKS